MQVSSQYANKLGKVFPDMIFLCKNVIVGYDGEEKLNLSEELTQGLMSRGINVYNIGNVSYSQFNFACSFYDNDGAILISKNYLLLNKKGILSDKKIKRIEKRIEEYKWKEKNTGEFIPLSIIDDYNLEMDKELHFSKKSIQINTIKDLDFLLPYTKLIKKSKTEIVKSKKLSVLIEEDKIRFFRSGEIFPEDILPNFFNKFQKSLDLSPLIKGNYSENIKVGGNSKGQYFFKNLKLSAPIMALIYFLNTEIKRTEAVFTTTIDFKFSIRDLKKELIKNNIPHKIKKLRIYNQNWFTATLKNDKLVLRGTKSEILKIKKIAKLIK